MTREELLAAILKAAAAFPVLRWPLAGAILAILADGLDVVVMNYVDLGGGGIRDYHAFDKLTDLPAVLTFAVVAARFDAIDRTIAFALFAWRVLGLMTFELLGWRGALIAAPNLFESWFLFVLFRDHLPALRGGAAGRLRPAWFLAGLVAFKLTQEWALHGLQILDRYTISDVVDRVLGRH
jgi:hypothetical protein